MQNCIEPVTLKFRARCLRFDLTFEEPSTKLRSDPKLAYCLVVCQQNTPHYWRTEPLRELLSVWSAVISSRSTTSVAIDHRRGASTTSSEKRSGWWSPAEVHCRWWSHNPNCWGCSISAARLRIPTPNVICSNWSQWQCRCCYCWSVVRPFELEISPSESFD